MADPIMQRDVQSEAIELTKEDIAAIETLPRRQFRVGNKVEVGAYDEATNRFYYLDEEGNWAGRVSIVKTRTPQPQEKEDEDEEESASEEGEKSAKGLARFLKRSGVEEKKSSAIKEALNKPITPKLPFKWLHVVIIATVIMVVAVFLMQPSTQNVFGTADTEQPQTPVEQPEQTGQSETPADPTLNSIQVIQVIDDLIPGDVVSVENIQTATVSAETYNQITLGGTNIYQWDRADSLIGKYVTAYIPAGQYLAYSNVASAYTPAKNPWVNEQQGHVYVTAPLDNATASSELMNFGAKVDMTIKKETVMETEAPPEVQEIEGLEHQNTVYQSISIDTYNMSNVIVCDLLNGDGESLYDMYTSLMEVPAGEQLNYIRRALLEDETLEASLTPKYIRIKIRTEQADALGDLSSKSISVSYKLHRDDIDTTTDEKREYAAQSRALADTIRQAVKLNAESAAMEEST